MLNNPTTDPSGLAYFALKGLHVLHELWIPVISKNRFLHDKQISHESLFFEDDAPDPPFFANLGFYKDSGLSEKPNLDIYHWHRLGRVYNDCVMWAAFESPALNWARADYKGLSHNCHSWASAMRAEYDTLLNDSTVTQKCCEKGGKRQ